MFWRVDQDRPSDMQPSVGELQAGPRSRADHTISGSMKYTISGGNWRSGEQWPGAFSYAPHYLSRVPPGVNGHHAAHLSTTCRRALHVASGWFTPAGLWAAGPLPRAARHPMLQGGEGSGSLRQSSDARIVDARSTCLRSCLRPDMPLMTVVLESNLSGFVALVSWLVKESDWLS